MAQTVNNELLANQIKKRRNHNDLPVADSQPHKALVARSVENNKKWSDLSRNAKTLPKAINRSRPRRLLLAS